MTTLPERLGADLRLLADLETQADRDRGADLRTTVRAESGGVDLERVDGVGNLQQALLLRLLTPVGELSALGHPRYGSRLHELVGEPNTESNRNRARLYALQALQAEPRVAAVEGLSVTTRRGEPNTIDIRARLVALREDTVLNLVFPFALDGAAT